jgi:hypothetical protein
MGTTPKNQNKKLKNATLELRTSEWKGNKNSIMDVHVHPLVTQ